MLLSGTTLYRKSLNKRVPDDEIVGNVQRIALCNQELNLYLFAGRFFMSARKMPNLLSGSVDSNYGLPHASTLSPVNNTENY